MNRWILIAALAAGTGLAGVSGAAAAQGTASPERADCRRGPPAQDRATCLREAAAARAEAQRGTLGAADEATLARNALRRCEYQPAGDARQACERLVRGEGTQLGSVAEGGILKELVTRSIEPAAPAASSP